MEPLVIRATMDDGVAHKTDGFGVRAVVEFGTCDAYNSAHERTQSSRPETSDGRSGPAPARACFRVPGLSQAWEPTPIMSDFSYKNSNSCAPLTTGPPRSNWKVVVMADCRSMHIQNCWERRFLLERPLNRC